MRFRYIGTGNAVNIDGGPPPNKISNIDFFSNGGLIIEAPSNAQHGLYMRQIQRSRFGMKCCGAGANAAGLRMEGCVLVTGYDVCVTNDDEPGGWYLNAKPLVGVSLDESGVGAQTSYCTFIGLNVQSTTIGIFLGSTLGNVFNGGDAEFCTSDGFQCSPKAFNNKIFGMDLEVNGGAGGFDIIDSGKYNEFIGCDTEQLVQFGSTCVGSQLIGGNHDGISIAAGAVGILLDRVKYSRGLRGATIINNGTGTAFRSTYNIGTNRYDTVPASTSNVSVGASPFVYTNTTNNQQEIVVVSGTVSNIERGVNGSFVGTGETQGAFTLRPGQQIRITHAGAPTLIIFN